MVLSKSNFPDPMDDIKNPPQALNNAKEKAEIMNSKDGKWVADKVSDDFSKKYQIIEDGNAVEAELRQGMLSEERTVELMKKGMGGLLLAYVHNLPATKEVLKATIVYTDLETWQETPVLEHFADFFDDEIARLIWREGGNFFVSEYHRSFPFVDAEGKSRLSNEMEQKVADQYFE